MSSPRPLTSMQFVLPDLFKMCPLQISISPHYPQAVLESTSWINSFGIFTGTEFDFFIQGGSELLSAYTYPDAGYDEFRTCCDFVNVLFTVDEISDEQDEGGARGTGLAFLNAMQDPLWNDGTKIGRICRELADRFAKSASPVCYGRLTQLCIEYVEAVALEARVRSHGVALDVDAYMRMRRNDSAVPFCLGLSSFVHGIDLPKDVYENPVFRRLHVISTDLVCISNDLYSFKKEYAAGHKVNNLVYILMEHKGIELQEACDEVGSRYGQLMDEFMKNKALLPSWDAEIDGAVAAAVKCMEDWVVGSLHWSFETRRYFGDSKDEVKRTRLVQLSE